MIEAALSAFVTLLVVIDPPGTMPMLIALTESNTVAERRHMAMRGTMVAGAILVVFAFVGEWLLRMLGVSINAFRIAGGLFLFFIAIDMLFAHQLPFRRITEPEDEEAIQRTDISVFPLAIPMIAGPGAMTTVVLLMQRAGGDFIHEVMIVMILVLVLTLLLLALLFTSRLMRILGTTGTNVISRVLGLILGALAVQYVLDGLRGVFAIA